MYQLKFDKLFKGVLNRAKDFFSILNNINEQN